MMDCYPIIILPLSEADGGGFFGYAPDLQGCNSDGQTYEECAANTRLAIEEWIDAAIERQLTVPAPFSASNKIKKNLERIVEEVKAGIAHIENRAEFVCAVQKEIDDALQQIDEWHRFAALTGMHLPPGALAISSRPPKQ